MTPPKVIPWQLEADASTDLTPGLLWRNGIVREMGAADVGFGLKAYSVEDIEVTRIAYKPAQNLRNTVDIAFGYRYGVGRA
jgi:hypothetical protein